MLAAVLAVVVALVVRFAWRLSGDLVPQTIEIGAEAITLRASRADVRLPTAGARARELTADERRHLERLASLGGIVAGSGGFDSHLLGEFELYAADVERAVLLESDEVRLIVTPDDPAAFVAAVADASGPSALLQSPPHE